MPRREIKAYVTADTKAAQKGLADVGKASQLLQGVLGRLGVVGQGISSILDKFTGKQIDMSAALGIGTAAVGAAVAIGEKAIGMYVALGEKVRTYAVLTGQSAEAASQQVSAFESLGVSADVAGAGMFKLAKAVEQTPAKLKELGIEIAHNADGTQDLGGTLLNVANAYQLTNDAAKRAAIVFTAFGKSGAAMIPILETNVAQLKQLEKQVASVFTQKDLDAIRQYKIQQEELKHQTDDLGVSLGRVLLPIQLQVTEAMNADIYATKTLAAAEGDRASLAAISGHASGKARDALIDQYRAAQEAKAKLDELTQAQKDAADAALAEAAAEETLSNAIHKNIDAGFAYRQSLLDLKKAQKDATAAKGKDAEANLRLAEAYVNVADAAVSYAEQQAEVNGTTLSAAEKADIWIAKLQQLEKGLAPGSPLRKEIDGYIAQLRSVPSEINTHFNASTNAFANSKAQKFAEGGVVHATPGGVPAILGEGGHDEAVIPLDGAHGLGGGTHYHFHVGMMIAPPGGMDWLARELLQRARVAPGT